MDRRIRRTKQAFKETIVELMRQKKFKDISVTDIVNHADYSRAAFYTHYKDKEELLEELTEDVLENLRLAYEEPYHEVNPLQIHTLKAENIKIFHHVHQYKDFYRVAILSEALPGIQKMITSQLKELLLLDFHRSSLSSSVEEELLAGYQAYAMFGMIMEWVEGGYRYSADYMAEQLLAILRGRFS
ncbi:TetR/AcrR family transcriptional regulator [Virgibacillus sp. MSP4-1]|uniref:TetR/AcrR family transcriptional regulator n=1 Tax=Virgibacillus sp. MSP4-1 TaxID=2700081 RepID=UPI00039DA119|nr:TetR-like C-terminal domain-containing protein [Virgibacillus sp. MSP4-1]QHS23329.1 TetR/AcrR family transcriptional regulator [Virgibacillus sp. MSP4-1]